MFASSFYLDSLLLDPVYSRASQSLMQVVLRFLYSLRPTCALFRTEPSHLIRGIQPSLSRKTLWKSLFLVGMVPLQFSPLSDFCNLGWSSHPRRKWVGCDTWYFLHIFASNFYLRWGWRTSTSCAGNATWNQDRLDILFQHQADVHMYFHRWIGRAN